MIKSRQLAAIMFTDIVGYTAMMGADEEKAFALLEKNRQLQQQIIQRYDGRWIKEIGDGVLASFSAITDAVFCANDIQHACAEIADLQLRISIHLGEVVFENGDVFGDGVNIAARLLPHAPIGGICVSESVHNNLLNKKGITSRFLREEKLKNVKEPMSIYEVIVDEAASSEELHTTNGHDLHRHIIDKSIAVLPFVNMSNDPEQEYFSDGMAEEILNSLTHLKDLKVAGRTSSFQFKGKNIDIREVGEKLSVQTVLEGSVRKQGNQLRVTAQLVNVEDGFHLWSERYDRKFDDVFAIQDDIAYAITEKLKITFFDNEWERIGETPTRNKEAYELFLKGRFYLNHRGAYIVKSIPYFEQAIALDPQFAQAHAGYADACLLSALFTFLPAKEAMPKAKKAAEAAIRCNSSLCDPYASLGFYYEFFEWNWAEAKKNFLKSIELNPDYVQGHLWYANLYLSWLEGKFDEAIKHAKLAIHLEPLSAIAFSISGVIYYTAARYEEAVNACKTAVELDPNSFLAWRIMGLAYVGLERYAEAKETMEHVYKLVGQYQVTMVDLIWVYHHTGNDAEAKDLMNQLDAMAEKMYVAPGQRGIAAAWLGNFDKAIEYLQDALDNRDPEVIALKYWPYVPQTLKDDPRYQAIFQQIHFPE